MAAIKNIIFDLGGVFLQIDYKKTEQAFVNLGFKTFTSYYRQDFVTPLFNDFEVGTITPKDFYDGIRSACKLSLTNTQIDNAWNAMMGKFWANRLHWLQGIKNNYKVYLLSNTNQIHYTKLIEIFQQQMPQHNFSNYFIKDYYSHTLGLRRPNVEAYEAVCSKENLLPQETLFIDDTLKNIEGASKAGLQVLHLSSDMDLIIETEKLLKLSRNKTFIS